MSEIAHLRRLNRLRKNGHNELAHRVESIGKEKGFKEDYRAIELASEGEGHNASLLSSALMLRNYWNWKSERVCEFLASLYERSERDVERAVAKAFAEDDKSYGMKAERRSKKPKEITGLANLIDSIPLFSLHNDSPASRDTPPLEAIRRLYSRDTLVNFGEINRTAGRTLPLLLWRSKDVEKMQFVVPNPMSATRGRNREGKLSARSLDNVLRREHVVIEFDSEHMTPDDQLGVVVFLAQFAPLRMILFSGGKSLHSWFYTGNASGQEQWSKFFSCACLFGADWAMRTECQYCRTPNVVRDNGIKQSLLFFDPDMTLSNEWDVESLSFEIRRLGDQL